jgi:hypothetical protein
MLCQAELPEFLWAEAMACTVYIQNRILNKQSKVTAYERIFNNAPSLHHVRLFGCKALNAQVSKEKRSAWDPKANFHTLVGYESSSDKYRLYDPEKRCIILARNVSFDESNQLISQNGNAPRPFNKSDSEDEEEQVEGGEPQQQDDDDDNSQTEHHDEEEEHQASKNEENEESQLNAEEVEGAYLTLRPAT